MRDDLLGAKGERRRLGRWEGEGLVERIRVERIGAAQHRRQCLQCRPNHVVVRLLRRQRHARRLRVESEL